MKKLWIASAVTAAMIMTGCGSSSDNGGESEVADFAVEKLFFFYDQESKNFYTYDSDHKEAVDVNEDTHNNINMAAQEGADIILWPHATTDANGTVSVEEKFVFVKAGYDIENDDNLTHENLIHIGHFHDEELYVHNVDEFDPTSDTWATYSDEIKQKKMGALKAINMHLLEQNEIKNEITEALDAEGKTLCNFFVAEHEEHDEEEEGEHNESEHEEEENHYALTDAGELYVFKEGEDGLEKFQGPLALTDATTCSANESGITSAGDYGVYVYLNSSETLYLIDSHGADFHEHTRWKIDELLPRGVKATQMIGFGESEDDHEDH